MNDPQSRRYRYPFIACPECGPGYTVTHRLPFARVNTTFAPFEPCEDCWEEFEDPGSRHFGSTTICCPDCGPSYWIEPAPPIDDAIDEIDSAVRALRSGAILGLKDTCCFRFVVRARDVRAVERLRRRMEEPDATFGLMVGAVDVAREIADVSEAAVSLLEDPSAPLVLLPRRDFGGWLDAATAGGGEVAVMLPRAAVHFLLMESLGEPLVVARAARRDDVAVLENDDARDDLMDVADALVLHDLDLHAGCEDSVLRVEDDRPVVLRRASGLAPRPLTLPWDVTPMLAIGGTHEVAIGLAEGDTLRLSQPVGDLGTSRANAAFRLTIDRMLALWDCEPTRVVTDPVRETAARALAAELGAETVVVDHHHAHVGSVLAEHGIERPVLGVSLDSSGQVVDPELGAGRILRIEEERRDVLETIPGFRVPGADAAPRDPWRVAVGLIHDACGPALAELWARRLASDAQTADSALSMLTHDVGCVTVHSFGKLYDAAAAVLGIARRTASAGVAARRLELVAGVADSASTDVESAHLEPASFLATWIERLLARAETDGDPAEDARWVQRSLSAWVARRAFDLAAAHGLDVVAAGGGCFSNPWLRRGFQRRAREAGLRLALNQSIPAGDSGLAVGQLWIAARRSPR
jgi:hydrogenase maturation protein HypF